MKINTVISGEMFGKTWDGYESSYPFKFMRNKKIPLIEQLQTAITGDFQKETVKLAGTAHITVTKRKGHIYTKYIDLLSFPSLATITI